jgi:hypothetical protein
MTDKDDEPIRRGDVITAVTSAIRQMRRGDKEGGWPAFVNDAIAALPAVQPVVTVKPLVWRGRDDACRAGAGDFGVYEIFDIYGEFKLSRVMNGNGRIIGAFPTLEAAKAAAQADYAARILAALDVQPAPDAAPLSPSGVDESLRAALAALEGRE